MLAAASLLFIFTICYSVAFFANYVIKGIHFFFFFLICDGIAAPVISIDQKIKKKNHPQKQKKHSRNNSQVSLSLSPFIMTSLGRHETRGSKSECSRLNTSSFKRPRHCICNCQSKAPNDYHNTKKVGKF